MSRLTQEERRRVFQAQEEARRTMLARLTSAPALSQERAAPPHGLSRIVVTLMIATLLGGGWLVYRALEFHPPASIVEALLPRM